MQTLSQTKKIYSLAAVLLFLSCTLTNAQDSGKKENAPDGKKKKTVTRIIISKDEDGKTLSVDTTIVGDGDFDMENFKKNFNFDFDFNMPELPDLADLPELPEPPNPPAPPDDRFYYYHFKDHKMKPEEREKFEMDMKEMKIEMEKSRDEMERAREEWSKVNKEDLKNQMEDLKKQMQQLKMEMKKEKENKK